VLQEWDGLRIAADALESMTAFRTTSRTRWRSSLRRTPSRTSGGRSVLESFETRDAYLEDLPAADTVLVLQALAQRRGLATAELESELLP
jgi:hypothetical protein